MNDRHSPQPWSQGHNVSHEPTVRSPNPDKDNGGFVIATFHGPRARDNARRTAACVNACEDIDIDFLEGCPPRFLVNLEKRTTMQRLVLLQQRDELLEALETILPQVKAACAAAIPREIADAEDVIHRVTTGEPA